MTNTSSAFMTRSANSGQTAVTLAPYALISRHNPPPTLGYYLLHEGAIGVLGDNGLQEVTYKTLDEKKRMAFQPQQCLARVYRQILGGRPAARDVFASTGGIFRERGWVR